MAIKPMVKAFLDAKNAKYEIVPHTRVFTSIDEAKALGIDADEIAKTLVIHVTHAGNQALVILPGGQKTSNKKINKLFGTKHARLATESEMKRDFSQFELGAVPPLGELLFLPAYIDKSLVAHRTVLFNGGTHTDSIKMMMHDFINLADAAVVDVIEADIAA